MLPVAREPREADPIPLNPLLVRLFCQEGEAGFRCGYNGGLLGQQIIDRRRVLPPSVREEQNPLPRRWFDHHGGTSRNSSRNNEAGEAARKSEREAEPSTASPQITRNGRCRSGSLRYLDAQRGVQRNSKTATSTGAWQDKREVSNTVSASGKNHNSLTTDRKTQEAIKGK